MTTVLPRVFADFDDLSDVETYVIDQCVAGDVAVLGAAVPEQVTDAVRVRAGVVRYLALGGCDATPVHEKGVRIVGGWIDGVIDLELCRGVRQLHLERCRIEAIEAMDCEIDWVFLNGSRTGALYFQGAQVRGNVFLKNKFHAKDEVSLSGAKIGGQLSCVGGTFENPGGIALNAQGAKIAGSVILQGRFTANGEVTFSGAEVGGQFECDGGTFENNIGHALVLQGAKIAGGVYLRGGFSAMGEVSLSEAEIGGQFSCIGGTFENAVGIALNAESVKIGNVLLRDGFHATGQVAFNFAQINGALQCMGGRFENKAGHAFLAEGVRITGSVYLNANKDGRFHASGPVRLSQAEIGGQLNCMGGRFENAHGVALNIEGATVAGGVLLRDGFEAKGTVNARNARFESNLDCTRGQFVAPREISETLKAELGCCAMTAYGAEIKGDLVLVETKSAGSIIMSGAHIGGAMTIRDSTFSGKAEDQLELQRMVIEGGLFFEGQNICDGAINLRGTKLTFLSDGGVDWPEAGIGVDGLTYKRLYPASCPVETRLDWLRKNAVNKDGFEPQPYSQLAKVLSEEGNRRDRGTVLMEMERQLRKGQRAEMLAARQQGIARARQPGRALGRRYAAVIIGVFRGWDWALDRVVGFGHRSERALVWSGGFVLATTLWAAIVWEEGAFAPSQAPVLVSAAWQGIAASDVSNPAAIWSGETEAGRDYETFQSLVWAADVFVPLIDFGQESAWAPSTSRGGWGTSLWTGRWVVKLAGWIITALGAAALTGLIRNE